MALEVKFEAPQQLGIYLIKQHVGDGGYGCVYRAVDTHKGEMVVVKFGSENDKQKDYKYLHNEVQALKNLQHENIVRLLDFSIFSKEDKESQCVQHSALVLENCICDLETVTRIFPHLHHTVIKTVAQQMFRGLAYLETSQLIHCDIKPQNLLLSSDGKLKLCDFGFARPSGFHNVRPGFTKSYSPLEVLFGVRNLDHTVDSWSAGCIITELFMRDRLFQNSTVHRQISAIFKLCGLTEEDWKEINPTLPKRYKREKIRYRARTLNAKLKDFVHDGLAEELISQLLVTNPRGRRTAKQVLTSAYFQHRPRPFPDLKMLANVMQFKLRSDPGLPIRDVRTQRK